MHREQRITGSGTCFTKLNAGLASKETKNCLESVRSLGVIGSGVVLKTTRVSVDGDGHGGGSER
jgi:hypothetical protein